MIVSRRIKPTVDIAISEDQHAYKTNNSAEIALIKIIDTITTQINTEPSTIRMLLVDTKKAFYSVEHKCLLTAIEDMCDKDIHCFLPWIQSFLTNRKQRIKLQTAEKTVFSNWKIKTRGLPQGTVTGPMYYNLITNDLQPKSNKSTYVKFADDLTVLRPISKTLPTDEMPKELNNVLGWSEIKKNENQCKQLIIQMRHKLQITLKISKM